jgi:uncharacterized protein (TIGR02996 family)
VTTLTPDLLAHVAAVRDKDEPDDTDLLALADHLAEAGDEDRAELVRVQVERERIEAEADPGVWAQGDEYHRESGATCGCGRCRLVRRERDLLARNPAWLSVPCPECGKGMRLSPPVCRLCRNTGDLIKDWMSQDEPSSFNDIQPRATIARGFLDITLPHTLCWRAEELWERNESETVLHPVLRAVLASPVGPWVRRVRAEGREPREGPGYEKPKVFDWFDQSRLAVYPAASTPKPIFERVRELGGDSCRPTDCYVEFPTAEAATDALSLAVPRWARGAK